MSKMTTNWLTRFAQVVAGRTLGEWTDCIHATGETVRACGPAHQTKTLEWSVHAADKDATFIKLSANVADEVLELVRAADSVNAHRGQLGFQALNEALAKLAAKVEQSC